MFAALHGFLLLTFFSKSFARLWLQMNNNNTRIIPSKPTLVIPGRLQIFTDQKEKEQIIRSLDDRLQPRFVRNIYGSLIFAPVCFHLFVQHITPHSIVLLDSTKKGLWIYWLGPISIGNQWECGIKRCQCNQRTDKAYFWMWQKPILGISGAIWWN